MSLQKSSIAGNRALAVEHAAGADRVADALIDAVLQRDANVVGEGLEAADARAIDDVAGALERTASVAGSPRCASAAC